MENSRFTFKDGVTIYLFAVLGAIAYNLVISCIFGFFNAESLISGETAVDWVVTLVSFPMQIIFFLSAFLYCRKRKTRFEFELKSVKPLGYILPIAAAAIALFGFYLAHISFSLLLEAMHYQSQGGIELNSVAGKIIGVIVTVIAAPIGEEVVFRGALLSGLKEKFKPAIAVVLSGLAFSLMHMNPEQTVYQFLLGATCAYLTLKSGSLLPAIIAHATSNLIACLMEIIPAFGQGFETLIYMLIDIPWLYALLAIALFAAAFVGIFFLGKRLERCAVQKAAKTFTARPPVMTQEDGSNSKSLLEKNAGSGVALYGIGIGATAFMWVMVFIVCIAAGNGWLVGLI